MGDDDSDKQKKDIYYLFNVRNVLQSFRIRYSFLSSKRTSKFLLDYNFYFLPPFGLLLWIILAFI